VDARKEIEQAEAAKRHAEYLAYKEQQLPGSPSAPASSWAHTPAPVVETDRRYSAPAKRDRPPTPEQQRKAARAAEIQKAVDARKEIEQAEAAKRHAEYLAYKEQQLPGSPSAPVRSASPPLVTPQQEDAVRAAVHLAYAEALQAAADRGGVTAAQGAPQHSGAPAPQTEEAVRAAVHAVYGEALQAAADRKAMSAAGPKVATTSVAAKWDSAASALSEKEAAKAAMRAKIDEAVAARKAIEAEDAARRHAEYLAFKEAQDVQRPARQSSPFRSGVTGADDPAKAARQARIQEAVAARRAVEADAAAQRAAEYQREKQKQTASR